MNVLVADSGSTKTSWRWLSDLHTDTEEIRTRGLNPFFLTTEEISTVVGDEVVPHIECNTPLRIFFYGAGCTPEKSSIVQAALRKCCPGAEVSVHSDMLGAARALCQDSPGIACILGTGANSCRYDGKQMVQNVSPLGFILGDEGSGAVLGKLFVGALLKGQMPHGLKERFLKEYGTTPEEIVDHVYRKPSPNTYLASFSPFIASHINLSEVYELVEGAFRLFIQRNVKQYPGYKDVPIHFVGSVAHHYRKVLVAACEKEKVELGHILKEPMEGLVEYHKSKLQDK